MKKIPGIHVSSPVIIVVVVLEVGHVKVDDRRILTRRYGIGCGRWMRRHGHDCGCGRARVQVVAVGHTVKYKY
jgi:hypothetical protein